MVELVFTEFVPFFLTGADMNFMFGNRIWATLRMVDGDVLRLAAIGLPSKEKQQC
jgi:hypothetical protein